MIDTMAPVLALLTAAALAFGLWRLLGTRRAEREAERLQDRIWRISESEDRYRALVAATTEIIVQRDARGRITYANEDFARLLGREPIALIGSRDDLEILDRSLLLGDRALQRGDLLALLHEDAQGGREHHEPRDDEQEDRHGEAGELQVAEPGAHPQRLRGRSRGGAARGAGHGAA